MSGKTILIIVTLLSIVILSGCSPQAETTQKEIQINQTIEEPTVQISSTILDENDSISIGEII